jgi:hypothetical protein
LKKILELAFALNRRALSGRSVMVHAKATGVQQARAAAAQTKQVAQPAAALLNSLSLEQRQNVAFDFIPEQTAVIAPSGDSTIHVQTIHREPTIDYGVKFSGAQ